MNNSTDPLWVEPARTPTESQAPSTRPAHGPSILILASLIVIIGLSIAALVQWQDVQSDRTISPDQIKSLGLTPPPAP